MKVSSEDILVVVFSGIINVKSNVLSYFILDILNVRLPI
jgi:hypothetical protein